MLKKFISGIKEKAIEQAKEFAQEKANELMKRGSQEADKRIKSISSKDNDNAEVVENRKNTTKEIEVITPNIISTTSDDEKYKDGDAFEKKLNTDLIEVGKNFASANPKEALEAFNSLCNMAGEVTKFTEVQKTKRKAIEAQRDIIVEQIKSNKEIILYTLEKTFDEREKMFRKYFEVIDDALSKNNIQQLQLGLGSINQLAATSPFKSLENIESTQKALNNKNHTWNF